MPVIFFYLQSFVLTSLSDARLSKNIKKAYRIFLTTDVIEYHQKQVLLPLNMTYTNPAPSCWSMYSKSFFSQDDVENWWVWQTWLQVLALLLASCVTLRELLNLSVSSSAHLSNEDVNNNGLPKKLAQVFP